MSISYSRIVPLLLIAIFPACLPAVCVASETPQEQASALVSKADSEMSIIFPERNEKALADYTTAIKLDHENVKAFWGRAKLYQQEGWRPGASIKAEADYRKAISLDPENGRIYHDRGVFYQGIGEAEKAYTDFDKAAELAPYNLFNPLARADLDRELGRFQDEVTDRKRVAELGNAGRIYDRIYLIDALTDAGELVEALKVSEETLTAARKDGDPGTIADTLARRARVLGLQGNEKGETADFDEALRLAKTGVLAYMDVPLCRIARGAAAERRSDWKRAQAEYTAGLAEGKMRRAQLLVDRAIAIAKTGSITKARLDLAAAIKEDKFDAANEMTWRLLTNKNNPLLLTARAQAFMALGRYKRAIPDLLAALSMPSRDTSLLKDLAQCQMYIGQPLEAETTLLQALGDDKEDTPGNHLSLALAMAAQGKLAVAQSEAQAALPKATRADIQNALRQTKQVQAVMPDVPAVGMVRGLFEKAYAKAQAPLPKPLPGGEGLSD